MLVKEITGERVRAEADVFAAVASLGTDTVRNVLLYHIVPASISYRDARHADGAVLGTLLADSSITVDVRGRRWKYVQLADLDTNDRDPVVGDPNVGGTLVTGSRTVSTECCARSIFPNLTAIDTKPPARST